MNASYTKQGCPDYQATETCRELLRLSFRKLAIHLSPEERVVLWCKIRGIVSREQVEQWNLASDIIELNMQRVYGKFGIYDLEELVRFGIFTSEEDIKVYIQS